MASGSVRRSTARLLPLLAFVLAACGGAAPGASGDDALLDRIEAQVTMPDGAQPLATYSRYYLRQGAVVTGIYLAADVERARADGHPPGRRWLAHGPLPMIADGGCYMVTVTADAEGQVRSVSCNGMA